MPIDTVASPPSEISKSKFMPLHFKHPSLRIGHTLLAAFLLLVILPIVLVTSLAYVSASDALRNEIIHRLQQDTTGLMQSIDHLLFERIENLRSWRALDVMQDASVGDVDKRLARFLSSLETSYGSIYSELLFRDPAGVIIASSDNSRIGKQADIDDADAIRIETDGVAIELLPVQPCHPQTTARCLPIRTALDNRFTGEPLGQLIALLSWRRIENELAQVTETELNDAHKLFAVLTNASGRIIGATAEARGIWPRDDAGQLQPLPEFEGHRVTLALPQHAAEEYLTADVQQEALRYFPLTGWRVVVLEAEDDALAPVYRLTRLLLSVALATTIIAILMASWLGNHIAQPIIQLARFSRHYDDRQAPQPPPLHGVTEVRELHHSLLEMIRRLALSRRQLVQASKLAAVGEMAATLAHEVRTPLGILSSSAQLLLTDQNLSEESREMAGFIISESARLNRLITLLLESGRPREPMLHSLEVLEPLRHSLSLLTPKANKQGVTLDPRLPDRLPHIRGDAEQLEQVFLNLLLNAIQAMPGGGTIRLLARAAGDSVIVEIADSGPGVPEADRQRIFEPFVSGRDSGFGLGLSIVQQIVHQHGGSIEVARSPLGGALFRLRFPNPRLNKKR